VLADLNYDYIYNSPPLESEREVIIESFSRNIAGAGGYVSCGLAKLGAEVFIITELGDDEDGNLLYHEIASLGVRNDGIRLCRDKKSPFTLIFTGKGEETPRQAATFPGTSLQFSISSVDYAPYVERSALVYSCNYFILRRLREEIRFVFRFARERNVLTAYDANAGDVWGDSKTLETLLNRIYPLTDIVFLNENEAGHITHTDDPVSRIGQICPDARTVVIKLGEQGAVVRHQNRLYRCNAFPLHGSVVDTIGAGDAFQAAFIYYYTKKFPIELCLVLGSANGASTVQYTGGTLGQLSGEELLRFLKAYRIMDLGDGELSIDTRR
jgi:sugar/nucleoside kinase (ribokinase family)